MAVHSDTELFALLDSARPVAFQTANQKPTKPKQGRGVRLEDPESWPEPVDGAALLDALAAVFERYLALPPHASTVLALWVLHTYNMDVAFTSPILAITSPVKQCGKTQLLIVLGAVVARRLFASNVTSAALFRTIEQYTPTLLIDEADTFLRDNEELRGVLNSGHTRTTASVIRTAGDDHEPRQFSTWCAKAIASIGRLPGTLADRAIEVQMRRRMAAITTSDVRAYIAERQATTEVVKKPYTIKRKDGTAIAVPEHRRPIAGAPNAEINRELTVLKRMSNPCEAVGKTPLSSPRPHARGEEHKNGFLRVGDAPRCSRAFARGAAVRH